MIPTDILLYSAADGNRFGDPEPSIRGSLRNPVEGGGRRIVEAKGVEESRTWPAESTEQGSETEAQITEPA